MRDIPAMRHRFSRGVQLYAIVSALLLTLWGLIYFDLQRAQTETLARNNSDLTNLALAFSKEIESSVKTIDVTLLDLREHWLGDAAHFGAAVRSRQNFLEKELAFQVAVIDAEGILRYSSLEFPTKPIDLSDREHFKVHRLRSTDELFISKPLLGRVSKRWSIQFTRPIYGPGDRFAGVLVLSVSPEYFYRFYRSIGFPQDSAITVVRQEGEILSRYPSPELALGKSLESPFINTLAPEAGTFEKISQVDGTKRLYAWRKIERFNLAVVVGHSLNQIMAPYHEQRSRALLAGASLSALLLLVGYLKSVGLRQQHRMDKQLADNEERWRLALEAAGDGVWDWDVAANRVVFSTGWKAMLGYAPDEIKNDLDEWRKRVHPDDMARVMQDIGQHFNGNAATYFNEHRMLCKDGRWKWILDRGMVITRAPDGSPLRMVGTHTDIDSRKHMEEILVSLATTDALTGICNRRSFMEKLENELARIKRYPDICASVLMADIDFFKKINDTYGHATGDAALKHFAKLLTGLVRESDLVGRLGGEEFAVFLPETAIEDAGLLARRLCAALRESPLAAGEHTIRMTVSIGVATFEVGDTSAEQALHRADTALYQAKNGGRDQVVAHGEIVD